MNNINRFTWIAPMKKIVRSSLNKKKYLQRIGCWFGVLLLPLELTVRDHPHFGAKAALFFCTWFGFTIAAICVLLGYFMQNIPFTFTTTFKIKERK